MARRSSVIHSSLHRPKTMMGIEPKAFLVLAFVASFLFAGQAYFLILFVVPLFTLARMWTKSDPLFMTIFLAYLDEKDAYLSIPRPEDWSKRPHGWGRGLPW